MLVAVTGATGLIGSALTESLRRDGHVVRRLTRSPRGPDDRQFDPARRLLDPAALEGADAVVHLAGERIDQRWDEAARHRILESRLSGTGLVASTIAALADPPKVLVSASAVGIYGDRGDEVLTEGSTTGDDFLADVARQWEGAAAPARAAGVRVVHPRTGIVLDSEGGALGRLLLPFRLGVGGPIGSGRQWMSWISLRDAVAGMRHAIERDDVVGPMNLTGPAPVRNGEFAGTLGRVLHRPAIIPVPGFALRVVFKEMADATLIASQRVEPAVLQRTGFSWQDTTLVQALRTALA